MWLEIVVQIFVGIELGGIGGQEKELEGGLIPPQRRCIPVQFLSRQSPLAFSHPKHGNVSPSFDTENGDAHMVD